LVTAHKTHRVWGIRYFYDYIGAKNEAFNPSQNSLIVILKLSGQSFSSKMINQYYCYYFVTTF